MMTRRKRFHAPSDRERSHRIALARSTLTHALCELDERRYSSALGCAAVAVVHLGHLAGDAGWCDLRAVIERVKHERGETANG